MFEKYLLKYKVMMPSYKCLEDLSIFVISGCNSAKVFEFSEESFDLISVFGRAWVFALFSFAKAFSGIFALI